MPAMLKPLLSLTNTLVETTTLDTLNLKPTKTFIYTTKSLRHVTNQEDIQSSNHPTNQEDVQSFNHPTNQENIHPSINPGLTSSEVENSTRQMPTPTPSSLDLT
jgi:hypothetical protein